MPLFLEVTKHERIEKYVLSQKPGRFPACYELFFVHFNAGEYYEAHDVLEHLWLECSDPNATFYKGLIQIAGGFVHLRRQSLRPTHPKDGKRLAPAGRLLTLGASNISGFGPLHMGLDVDKLSALCNELSRRIENSDFQVNPWSLELRPTISLAG